MNTIKWDHHVSHSERQNVNTVNKISHTKKRDKYTGLLKQ
jgi:hypothetical protein